MPNPSGPDDIDDGDVVDSAEESGPDPDEQVTDSYPTVPTDGEAASETGAAADAADPEAVTEVFTTEAPPAETEAEPAGGAEKPPERRFTAPGFDAGKTEIIPSMGDAETEVIHTQQRGRLGRLGKAGKAGRAGKAQPQLIPPSLGRKLPGPAWGTSRSWGWVLAVFLIVLTLAVIAVLGTVWLTHSVGPKVSQEDRVRETIHNFDIAVQTGDLATLRSITCGDIRDGYVNYDERTWDDTYRRVEAAKQYPVVASIDEVVVNDGHAEANVTAFMAYAPRIRSTRSFDLQYRDDQWKICQSHAG